jgi:redox-sensitive bicupin YhaK (pirin superfamily)
MISVRKAQDRGHANHGWLDTWHSFSFADYYNPERMGFGPLRVINDDRVEPGMGFGTHGHRDMEIITYILDGQLEHKDSMGTGSIIVPGDVQRMSAGRGITHSEYNPSREKPVHLLQIWIEPSVRGIKPEYEQKLVADIEKRGRFKLIASADGRDDSVLIHQDASIYAALVDGSESATYALAKGRRGYVHVARGSVLVNGEMLDAGDAVTLTDEARIVLDGGRDAEVLLFDLP